MAGEGLLLDNFEFGSTVRLTASTSLSTATFTATQDIAASDMILVNEGSNIVFWASSNSKVGTLPAVVPNGTPAIGGNPLPVGSVMTVKKGVNNDTISFITASSTSIVDVTAGVGT